MAPKRTEYPRLRTHVRKGKNGRVWVYYVYDMRGTGKPDVPLGTARDAAIRRWDELHNRARNIAGTVQEAIDRFRAETLPRYESAETQRDYAKCLRALEPVFGPATWDTIDLPVLAEYLRKRSGKTRANRELSVLQIVWNKARVWGMVRLPWPAAGMERAKWKNPEKARRTHVGDLEFAAIYVEADQLLRDAMDLISATGLRVRDAIALPMTADPGTLLLDGSSKRGKAAEFDISQSVLRGLVERRAAIRADHLLLLTSGKRRVTERMLGDRWKHARTRAAEKVPSVARLLLRDMRKYAANLCGSLDEAKRLLQHDDARVTRAHYRTKAERLKAVR